MDQEWNYERLRRIAEIDHEQERYNLEFKSCDELRWKPQTDKSKDAVVNELSRDVSAMANSAGGIIIYGIVEDEKSTAEKLDLNSFTPSDECDPEWLDQVIRTNIMPAPDVRITRVFINDDRNQGWYYVVDVKQGVTAHYSRDKKFYRRQNTTKQQMEYHEIVDVMNRAKGPVLEARLRIKDSRLIPLDRRGRKLEAPASFVDIDITTRNYISADHGMISLYVLRPLDFYPFNPLEETGARVGNYDDLARASKLDLHWSIHAGKAVYPNHWTQLNSQLINILLYPANYTSSGIMCLLRTEIYGPNMPVRVAWYMLITDQSKWRIDPIGSELDPQTVEQFWMTYRDWANTPY